MSIHSQDEQVILEFGLKKSAFRIVVNTPTTLGSIGMTTGLDPSMTLGCGGHGGNITSDNITPRHLLNTKRLAYGIRPARAPVAPAADSPEGPRLPEAPSKPKRGGIDPALLSGRIETFLASRGIAATSEASPPSLAAAPTITPSATAPVPAPPPVTPVASTTAGTSVVPEVDVAVDFVCEDDVRQALRDHRRITVGEGTIITPSAQDLGQQHHVFVQAELPR
ncbi:MAG TPA: hypothetical protein EYQ83_12395 [Acidobacteria bacterium]|nr:hypothetical protein [Acidobacteriota bacterium]